MGFVIHTELQGAFYVFCDAVKFTNYSCHFAFDVFGGVYVGVTPEIDFVEIVKGLLASRI